MNGASRRWRGGPVRGGRSRRLIHRLRPTLMFLALVGIVLALIATIRWYSPVNEPGLHVLYATYDGRLIPENHEAEADASHLSQLSNFFKSPISSQSLSETSLEQVSKDLSEASPFGGFLFRGATTEILYVNAAGVSLPQRGTDDDAPFLLTNSFDTGRELMSGKGEPATSLNSLIDAVAACEADCKVVVLDCQKFEYCWPLGIHSNRFVESAEKAFGERDDLGCTFVIFSSSPGQVSWENNASGGTIFSDFFIRGIQGAADGKLPNGVADQRVTLDELFEYTQHNVENWVRDNRDDIQMPKMVTFGTMPKSEVVLATITDDNSPIPSARVSESTAESTTTSDLESLAALWQRAFELQMDRESPEQFAPVAWNLVLEELRLAEHRFLDGEFADFRQRLKAAEEGIQDVTELRSSSLSGRAAYSLPMLSMLHQSKPLDSSELQDTGDTSPENASQSGADDSATVTSSESSADGPTLAGANAGLTEEASEETQQDESTEGGTPVEEASGETASEAPDIESAVVQSADGSDQSASSGSPEEGRESVPEAELTAAEIDSIVQMFIRGGELDEAGIRLAQRPATQTLPQSAEFLEMLARFTSQVGPEAGEERARELLKSRYELESQIYAAGTLTPQVFAWLRASVEAADFRQRATEDRYWATGAPSLPIQSTFPNDISLLKNDDLGVKVLQVSEAFRIWNRLLLELPYLTELAAARPYLTQTERTPLPEVVRTSLMDTLSELSELGAILHPEGEAIDRSYITSQLPKVVGLTRSLSIRRTALNEALARESQLLTARIGASNPRPGTEWRRYEAILMLPFAIGETASPKSAAERRVKFLSQIRAFQAQAIESVNADEWDENSVSSLPDGRVSQEARSRDLMQLGMHYFSVGSSLSGLKSGRLQNVNRTDEGGFNGQLESAVQRGIGVIQTKRPAATLTELIERDLWSRLLPATWVKKSCEENARPLPPRLCRHQQLSDLYVWLARRARDDFWGVKSEASGRYYFDVVSRSYLDEADDLNQLRSSDLDRERKVLQEVVDAAAVLSPRSPGIVNSRPESSRLIGTDRVRLHLSLKELDNLPTGLVRVECISASDSATVEEVGSAQETGDTVVFDVIRRRPTSLTNAAIAKTYYRGHLKYQPILVSAVGEEGAPAVRYEQEERADSDILVRWSRLEQRSVNVLFVLDCSRSMNADGRITALRESLMRFSDLASQSDIRVGIRVFGDRVVWRPGSRSSELLAQKDTRVLLPIQPFVGKRFGDTVGNLRAFGETPLFRAVIDSKSDFDGLPEGDNLVVVVSDGADNWAGTAQGLGIKDLERAYANSGIRVSAIGFQTDDRGFSQLQQIAGVTGGTAVRAEQGVELLDQVFGLTEVLTYSLYRRESGLRQDSVFVGSLQASPEPIPVPPGEYDLEVTDYRGQVRASRSRIRVRPNQRHELVYLGSKLAYPAPRTQQDVAFVADSSSGALLRILEARPNGDSRIEVEIAIQNPDQPEWWPEDVTISIRPKATNDLFLVEGLSPNGVGHHFPTWKLTLENWPHGISFADIQVSWSSRTDVSRRQAFEFASEDEAELQLRDGIRVTRRSFSTIETSAGRARAARLTFVNTDRPASLAGWSFGFDVPVRSARYTSDLKNGIRSATVQFSPGSVPQHFDVVAPSDPSPSRTLDTTFEIRLRQIN